jgi:hypothetical protein
VENSQRWAREFLEGTCLMFHGLLGSRIMKNGVEFFVFSALRYALHPVVFFLKRRLKDYDFRILREGFFPDLQFASFKDSDYGLSRSKIFNLG